MIRVVFSLMLCLGLLAGCANEPKGDDWARSHAKLVDRMSAAKNISDSEKRDDALVDIATDATKKNDAAVALEAVNTISDSGKRDRKAKDCAIAFHKYDDRAVARKFVELVNRAETRDELNARFAK